MTAPTLATIATTFGALSLGAVGGANTVVPDIQRIVVDEQHWMDPATFSHLFAISQIAPGPNILLASLLGWQVLGVMGLLVATVAMLTPSCVLAFFISRLMGRYDGLNVVRAFRLGLAPVAVGLMLASGLVLARGANANLAGWALTAAAAAFVLYVKLNPAWALLAAATIGALAAPTGLFG